MAVDRSRLTSTTRLALVERETAELRVGAGDHEKRIRSLERLTAKVLGAAAAGGLLAGFASAFLAKGGL